MKGQGLQVEDKFTYLGSTLSRVMYIDDEVNARIAKASAALGRLCGGILYKIIYGSLSAIFHICKL